MARLLLEQFGEDAARYAAARLTNSSTGESRRQWRAILEQLSELIASPDMRSAHRGTPPSSMTPLAGA